MFKQFKEIDGKIQHRKIYESQIEGKLLKLKKGLTSTQVQFEYHFYHRKFDKNMKK